MKNVFNTSSKDLRSVVFSLARAEPPTNYTLQHEVQLEESSICIPFLFIQISQQLLLCLVGAPVADGKHAQKRRDNEIFHAHCLVSLLQAYGPCDILSQIQSYVSLLRTIEKWYSIWYALPKTCGFVVFPGRPKTNSYMELGNLGEPLLVSGGKMC